MSTASLEEGLRKALTEDILNRDDGAGSDLEFAEDAGDDTFIELSGALDVSALTNTALAFIRAEIKKIFTNPELGALDKLNLTKEI